MNKLYAPLGRSLLAAGLACVAAAPVLAADSLTVSKSVEVAADPAKTWNAIKDFDGLHKWHPAVEKTEIKKGGANKVGTVRVLSLKGGGTITETLTKHDDKAQSLSYKIEESPLPVDGYDSTIAVKPAKAGSTVVWSSTFKAKAGATDADAKKTIEGIYDAGLGNLKKQLGG